MITDWETNLLYLADTLPAKYWAFYGQFKNVIKRLEISYKLIPNTKDIWAVDYMPIQIGKQQFVKFSYNPDYLQGALKWKNTISNVNVICKELQIEHEISDIVLDGGNVVKVTNKVILCDKVFNENPGIEKISLINALKSLFEVDTLIFIPTDPYDIIGHADGLVRFYDDDTVLINQYLKKDSRYASKLRSVLQEANLHVIEIPYNPYNNKTNLQANGIYINYLQMHDAIILPTFGLVEDNMVLDQFKELFPKHRIETVNSTEIANHGGVLNCISWNISSD